MKEQLKLIKWDRILTAILAILMGLLFIFSPDEASDTLLRIASFIVIISGIASIICFFKVGHLFGGSGLTIGIILIILGMFTLIHPDIIKSFLTILFGIYILFDGGRTFSESMECKRAGINGWLTLTIFSLFTIVLGLIVLFGTFDNIMVFAGISLVLDGALSIISILLFSHKIKKAKDWVKDNLYNI